MAAIMLVGMAISAYATYASSKAQAAAQEGQARANQYAAQQQTAAGVQNAANNANTADYQIGSTIAREASNGGGAIAGSGADIIGQMYGRKDFNAKTTMANAANAANNLAYQGQLASFGAQQTNSAMPLALASSLVTGATKFGQSSGAFSGWANTNSQASSQYYYG